MRAEAGDQVSATITVERRAFAHWDAGWQYEAGTFALSLGFSVNDLFADHTVTI